MPVRKETLYCAFPVCYLDTTWTKTGVTDLKPLGKKFKEHEDSAKHLKNMIGLAMLGTINIASQLSNAYRQQMN
jgi:hypothetical protein